MYTSLTHLSAYAPESGAWLAILPLVQGAAEVGRGAGMLCAQARCQISCVSSAGADLGWDCEQPWVGTGQALPRSASMKHSPHGHPSLWESCPPSVWLSRDRCGTGRSGAQVRGATTKQPFGGSDCCCHRMSVPMVASRGSISELTKPGASSGSGEREPKSASA